MNSEELYRDTMGPYFYEFCHRLHALATMYSTTANTRVYFCRRAGVVLYELFRLFLKFNHINPSYDLYDFPVSRIAAIKAALAEDPMWGGHVCSIVFKNKTVRYLIEKLLLKQNEINTERYLSSFESTILDAKITPGSVKQWLSADSNNEIDNSMVNYLNRQKKYLAEHFSSLAGSNAIIVDSGLYGTVSEILSGLYPAVKCVSGFVYLSNYNKINPSPHMNYAYGLMGSSTKAEYSINHSAVLRHWHFIEKLLEPDNIDSVSEYSLKMEPIKLSMNHEQSLVADFFKSPSVYNISGVLATVNRVLSHPSSREVSIIYSSLRTDDASDESKHIIINHELEASIRKTDRLRRVNYGIVRRALWREGQIVTSYGLVGYVYNGVRYYIAKAHAAFLAKLISPIVGG